MASLFDCLNKLRQVHTVVEGIPVLRESVADKANDRKARHESTRAYFGELERQLFSHYKTHYGQFPDIETAHRQTVSDLIARNLAERHEIFDQIKGDIT